MHEFTYNFNINVIASCLLLFCGVNGDDMVDDDGVRGVKQGMKTLGDLREFHPPTFKNLWGGGGGEVEK